MPNGPRNDGMYAVLLPYARRSDYTIKGNLLKSLALPRGLEPVFAVRGHFPGYVVVHRCPGMSLNTLKSLDTMSIPVYSDLRTSPGHCRDTRLDDHGAKCKSKETRNAGGPPETAGGQEARV